MSTDKELMELLKDKDNVLIAIKKDIKTTWKYLSDEMKQDPDVKVQAIETIKKVTGFKSSEELKKSLDEIVKDKQKNNKR